MFLRQSTSQVFRIGPFVDATDGVSPETGLTINNTDVDLSKAGGAFASKNSGGLTVDGSNGWYSGTLDATDTDTVGILEAEVTVAGALPVFKTFYVVEENVYDAYFAASAAGGTDLAAILADTADMQPKLGTPAGASISADIATLDTVADGIQTDLDNGTDGLGAIKTAVDAVPDAATTADAVWDEAVSGHNTNGTFGQRANAWTSGNVSDAGPLATDFDTDLSEASDDHYNNHMVIFTSGALKGQSARIDDYDGTAKNMIFAEPAFTEAPANGDDFLVSPFKVASLEADGQVHADVKEILGTAPTLSAGVLDVNIQSTDDIDLSATQKASVNAEVDTALNTAIPGGAAANSINERIAAIDDLTQSGGSGDLAAVLADTADMQPKLGTPAADLSADIAAVKVDTAATLIDTAEIGAAGAGLTEAGGTGDQLTAVPWNPSWDAEVQSEVDDALNTAISDSTPADGSIGSLRETMLQVARFLMESSVSGTTVTVKKEDGSTTAMTFTLDDGTTPTSITRAT